MAISVSELLSLSSVDFEPGQQQVRASEDAQCPRLVTRPVKLRSGEAARREPVQPWAPARLGKGRLAGVLLIAPAEVQTGGEVGRGPGGLRVLGALREAPRTRANPSLPRAGSLTGGSIA